jgi:hypothetical protein
VLVFLSIGSRRIEYIACTPNPDTAWMLQQPRNLLMDLDDRGRSPRFLIHDRDTKVRRRVRRHLRGRGHHRHPHSGPGAKRERSHGALASFLSISLT